MGYKWRHRVHPRAHRSKLFFVACGRGGTRTAQYRVRRLRSRGENVPRNADEPERNCRRNWGLIFGGANFLFPDITLVKLLIS
jgi:hypothetical protein